MFVQRSILLNLYDEVSVRRSLVFNSNILVTAICSRRVFRLYKGNVFRGLFVDRFIVGRRFCEFNFVRKPFTFVQKKKQIKQNFIRR